MDAAAVAARRNMAAKNDPVRDAKRLAALVAARRRVPGIVYYAPRHPKK